MSKVKRIAKIAGVTLGAFIACLLIGLIIQIFAHWLEFTIGILGSIIFWCSLLLSLITFVVITWYRDNIE